jgi:hypothetical protein
MEFRLFYSFSNSTCCCYCYSEENVPSFPMPCCGHIGYPCLSCIDKYIASLLDSSNILWFQCFYCRNSIPASEIQKMVSPEVFARLERVSIANYLKKDQSIVWCPNVKCSFPFSLEMPRSIVSCSTIACPQCQTDICLLCHASHPGSSCYRYNLKKNIENDQKLKNWAVKNGATQCPKCKITIERIEGCDHMTCPCGYEFCYVCGADSKKHLHSDCKSDSEAFLSNMRRIQEIQREERRRRKDRELERKWRHSRSRSRRSSPYRR